MLSIGIVGLPNVGKSTLFNTLTKKKVPAENFPFCTIDPNIGVVEVPDERLEQLAQISHSKKIIRTAIEFVDIAGLVRNAHKGEGLGNQFLSHIREVDAICEVVRNFSDPNVIHVEGDVNPERDLSTIQIELAMADLQSIENRMRKVEGKARTGDKESQKELMVLEKAENNLNEGRALRDSEYSEEEMKILKPFNFLTQKPILYVLNIDENDSIKKNKQFIPLSIKIESEIAELPEEEQIIYLKELGLEKTGLDTLITEAYKLLGLITFLTTGEPETRAWTVKNGAKAPEAAGVIHTDFEKGFIRAEVYEWQKLIEYGSEVKLREKGLIRTEGKDYIMRDGDVCHFLVNRN